ncbi:putative tetratricopeptide-like helical domain superfamily [Helianthus debilis subsp. tardiflorus]
MIVSWFGYAPTVFVTNCLIHVYIRCSKVQYAHKVFGRMAKREAISWNAMVFGYAGIRNMGIAKNLFDSMLNRDGFSWNALHSFYYLGLLDFSFSFKYTHPGPFNYKVLTNLTNCLVFLHPNQPRLS